MNLGRGMSGNLFIILLGLFACLSSAALLPIGAAQTKFLSDLRDAIAEDESAFISAEDAIMRYSAREQLRQSKVPSPFLLHFSGPGIHLKQRAIQTIQNALKIDYHRVLYWSASSSSWRRKKNDDPSSSSAAAAAAAAGLRRSLSVDEQAVLSASTSSTDEAVILIVSDAEKASRAEADAWHKRYALEHAARLIILLSHEQGDSMSLKWPMSYQTIHFRVPPPLQLLSPEDISTAFEQREQQKRRQTREGEDRLRWTDRFVGQPHVLDRMEDMLREVRAKISLGKQPQRFIFAGPPGAGKSYLAKLIAEELNWPLHVYQMAGLKDETALNIFIGASPGYMGEADLLEKLKANPRSVVLLDEVEKSHPSLVKDFLLPVFEEGQIMPKRGGGLVDASKAIWILTSNCFQDVVERLWDHRLSETSQMADRARGLTAFVAETLLGNYSYECPDKRPNPFANSAFVSRLGDKAERFLLFVPLSENEVESVYSSVLYQFRREKAADAELPLHLVWSESLPQYLAIEGIQTRTKKGDTASRSLAVRAIRDHAQSKLLAALRSLSDKAELIPHCTVALWWNYEHNILQAGMVQPPPQQEEQDSYTSSSSSHPPGQSHARSSRSRASRTQQDEQEEEEEGEDSLGVERNRQEVYGSLCSSSGENDDRGDEDGEEEEERCKANRQPPVPATLLASASSFTSAELFSASSAAAAAAAVVASSSPAMQALMMRTAPAVHEAREVDVDVDQAAALAAAAAVAEESLRWNQALQEAEAREAELRVQLEEYKVKNEALLVELAEARAAQASVSRWSYVLAAALGFVLATQLLPFVLPLLGLNFSLGAAVFWLSVLASSLALLAWYFPSVAWLLLSAAKWLVWIGWIIGGFILQYPLIAAVLFVAMVILWKLRRCFTKRQQQQQQQQQLHQQQQHRGKGKVENAGIVTKEKEKKKQTQRQNGKPVNGIFPSRAPQGSPPSAPPPPSLPNHSCSQSSSSSSSSTLLRPEQHPPAAAAPAPAPVPAPAAEAALKADGKPSDAVAPPPTTTTSAASPIALTAELRTLATAADYSTTAEEAD